MRSPDDPPVEILYQSPACLVVMKPAGLATQAPAQFDSLERRLRTWLGRFPSPHGHIYLGVPHRLDRPVSGAIVFALRRRAAFKLSRQFERREVKKVYWACVEGQVEPADGTWADTMRKVYGHPRAELVPADHPDAQKAVLHYRTLELTPFGSLLEIELETGRTHQIRVQASSRGHPVLGDAFYGGRVPFGVQHADERLRAIALHARKLSFTDPAGKNEITVVAPLPDDWRGFASG
ncbi:MAG TPA: RluA family pseudouridine synthase [Pirellulales bacterium]|nr:RluA family pseudouridine synthase [Pirellulales bacterium]